MHQQLSAVIICRNAEARLAKCLKSLDWVDEIVAVDSYSTDKTLEICRKYTHKVYQHPFESYASQKSWAVDKASNRWVLAVDADEWITEELANEIRQALQGDPQHTAYRIRRINYFLGMPVRHCGWQHDWVVRLFDRHKARFIMTHVHEGLEVDGSTGKLKSTIGHYPYLDLDEYFAKLNQYSKLGALDSMEKGKRAGALTFLTRSVGRFLKTYVLNLGFLDGKMGLAVCLLASISVLAKYLRLWEMTEVLKSRDSPGA